MLYSSEMSADSQLFEQLLRIRIFEETVLSNFSRGIFFGTTHSCLGQEANAVGVISNIHPDDIVVSNHRSHGHFIAYGGDIRALFAEMMGRSTGVVAGRGGTQHLQWKNFYSNGIQGGILPISIGMALAEKFKSNNVIVLVFMGDGTLGEGVVYESLNMASLWNAPVLLILENNRIAQTTPIELALAGDIEKRFSAFDIPVDKIDSSDVNEISQLAEECINDVRNQNTPHAMVINTYRFGPHSKGDDTRNKEDLKKMRAERDPIQIQGQKLDTKTRTNIALKVQKEIQAAFNMANNDPFPEPDQIFKPRI